MEKVYDLPGQFLLLCLDPATGKIRPAWYTFSYGLAGAILLELGLREQVALRHGRIWLKDQRLLDEAVLDDARNAIRNSPRKKRPGQWLIRLSYPWKRYKRMIISDWERRGLIRISSRKILGFWAYDEVSLRDPSLRDRQLEILMHTIRQKEPLQERELALLVLIDAGKLHYTLGDEPDIRELINRKLDEHLAQKKCALQNLSLIREVRNAIRSVITSAIGIQPGNSI